MNFVRWLRKEALELTVLFLYFAFYFGLFIVFKKLILAHYHINYYGFGTAMVGALIAAKAVLVIESSPLSKPLRASAPYLKVLYDTFMFSIFALILLYLEKSLELLHKEGTFRLAFLTATKEDDLSQFCATVGWASLSFLNYAVFAAISRHLGKGKLLRLMFTAPQPGAREPDAAR